MPELSSDGNDNDKSFEIDLLKPSIIALKREKQFMEHVLKCFTWGRPVRRDTPLINDEISWADEFRRRFNWVRLIRNFFSIKRRNLNRKFDYPIDQLGKVMNEKTNKQDY